MSHQTWLDACSVHVKRLSVVFVFGSMLLLYACGGGSGSANDNSSGSGSTGDSGGSAPVNETVTGQFIDAAVAGLRYSCSSGKSGVTDTNGSYTCNKGDTVSFSINGFVIGSATTSDIITPSVLTSDTTQALNVAQLLQTLDSDGDPSNGISIAQSGTQYAAMGAMASDNVSLAQGNFDTTASAYLGETLVDEATAQTHLNESIASLSFTAADIKAAFAGKTVYPAKPTPAYSEEWVVAADGMSADGNGVDGNGPYGCNTPNTGCKLFFSYSDTSVTVSSDVPTESPVTFTVKAITSNYIETNLGNIYYTQAEAYTDAIISAFAGKKLYPQQTSLSYSQEWAFDVAGAATTITCVDANGDCSGPALTSYKGAKFSITSTDPRDSDYGIPNTFTVLDITPDKVTVRDANGNVGGIFYSQQAAYVGL